MSDATGLWVCIPLDNNTFNSLSNRSILDCNNLYEWLDELGPGDFNHAIDDRLEWIITNEQYSRRSYIFIKERIHAIRFVLQFEHIICQI